jgi:hypothetical protein
MSKTNGHAPARRKPAPPAIPADSTTALGVHAIIRALPPAERGQLYRMLAGDASLYPIVAEYGHMYGYAIKPVGEYDRRLRADLQTYQELKDSTARQARGPQVRRDRAAARNALIDRARSNGITAPTKIRAFVLEHCPESLQARKPANGKAASQISTASMMKGYARYLNRRD